MQECTSLSSRSSSRPLPRTARRSTPPTPRPSPSMFGSSVEIRSIDLLDTYSEDSSPSQQTLDRDDSSTPRPSLSELLRVCQVVVVPFVVADGLAIACLREQLHLLQAEADQHAPDGGPDGALHRSHAAGPPRPGPLHGDLPSPPSLRAAPLPRPSVGRDTSLPVGPLPPSSSLFLPLQGPLSHPLAHRPLSLSECRPCFRRAEFHGLLLLPWLLVPSEPRGESSRPLPSSLPILSQSKDLLRCVPRL